MSDEGDRATPPTVIGALAAGVAPAPFLLTYSVLFILHGTVFPVDPPDITGSHGGEALAGVVALVFLGLIILGLGMLLSGRARWLFLVGQLATLGVSIEFLLDATSGRPEVPVVLAVASTTAIVLGCLPPSWRWVSGAAPRDAEPEPPRYDAAWREQGGGPIDPNPYGGPRY